MRDLVTRKSYRLRKKFDDFLYWMMPNTWIPLYNSVSFSHMPYKQCIENRKWQDKVWFITYGIIFSILFTFDDIYSQMLSRLIGISFTTSLSVVGAIAIFNYTNLRKLF